MKPANKIYESITEKVLAELEKGTVPWVRPWEDGISGMPTNHITGHLYSGVNVLMMWMAGFASNQFGTYKQFKDAGLQVQRGEKGVQILRMEKIKLRGKDEDEEPGKNTMLVPRWHSVFNLEQTDFDLAFEIPDIQTPEDKREILDYLLSGLPVRILHGAVQAYYDPKRDQIVMPEFEQFKSPDLYYATLLHELVHWTGHTSRLDRLHDRDKKEAVAFEELIAEIGSAFLCAEYGVPSQLAHQGAYIESWLKALNNDKTAIIRAASAATKAVSLIKQISQP